MRLGSHKQIIIISLFLLYTVTAYSQAGKSHKYHLDGSLQETGITVTDHSLIINYTVSEINIESLINENGTFYRASIPGHIPTCEPGKPELPVLSRLIIVPEGCSYRIKISDVRSSKIRPGIRNIDGILFPAQEGETKELQKKKPQFVIDKAAYSARRLLHSDTLKIVPLGKVRGKNLANLLITPVRYNPHANNLEIITSMKIEIIFPGISGAEAKALFPESKLFSESLAKGVLNYNPDDIITGYTEEPIKMVIITDTAFRKHLEPFFIWKIQKGYKLTVLYKGEGLAGNSYAELKDTLASIYNASSGTNPPPDYLLIIGDVNKVPYYGTGNVTDMYYGEFDGNGDYMPEMFIGRLPVADTAELKNVVNKIIQYEKFEFADSNRFYSNSLISAGNDDGHAYYMNGQIKYSLDNYLNTANNINEYHFYEGDISATTKTSIINHINNGVSFFNYSGHGQVTGLLIRSQDPSDTANIYVSDLSRFKNRNMYPFIIGNACKTSTFNTSSYGNEVVVAENTGAIGYIGCANDSYWDEDFYWAVGTGTPSGDPKYETTGLGAIDRLFHNHGESPSDWYVSMGQVNYAGNLSVSASNSYRKKYYWEIYNLVGDPSIIPILGIPDSFNITLPDILPNGTETLNIAAEPFAYLAVSHFDTLWDASFAGSSGSVMLDMPGLINDSCLVVITGQNKVPFIKTIYFSDVIAAFIDMAGYSVNDSLENNNGAADFGENFYLNVKITNLGLTAASNLYATLTSESEWITINNDSVMIGALPARSEIILADDFAITVAENIPDNGIVTFDLKLKDSLTEKHYKIDICLHAPQLEIISYRLDDITTGNGNYIADPGETLNLVFLVQNKGSSNTSGQFNIASPDTNIMLLQPSVKSGTLVFGEIAEIPIPVKISEWTTSGSYISINSSIDCDPYFANKSFSFRVGRIRETFESSSFSIFPWINISSIPWIITGTGPYEGTFSARSGVISHNQSSVLKIRTEYPAADSLKFFYKVSSEINCDFLIFKLNGTEVFRKSGETSWEKKVIAVPAGLNEMEWIYQKDQSIASGADHALLDLIDFAGPGTVRYIQRDIEVTGIKSPVQEEHPGYEPVSVKVLNHGPDTINGFNLAYTINSSNPVRQYFGNSHILPGDSVDVTFSTPANLSYYGFHEIVVYGYNNDDDYIFNDTVKINIRNTDLKEPIEVSPNPFTDKLKVIINSKVQGTAYISLTNPAGKKISSFETPVLEGRNEVFIEDDRLVPSVYYLRVEFPGSAKTIPVIKTRN